MGARFTPLSLMTCTRSTRDLIHASSSGNRFSATSRVKLGVAIAASNCDWICGGIGIGPPRQWSVACGCPCWLGSQPSPCPSCFRSSSTPRMSLCQSLPHAAACADEAGLAAMSTRTVTFDSVLPCDLGISSRHQRSGVTPAILGCVSSPPAVLVFSGVA